MKRTLFSYVFLFVFATAVRAQEGIVRNFNPQALLKNNNVNGGVFPKPNAMNKRFLNGQTEGELFGYSVSNAGDVNGDGFSDIIVGAERYSNDAGRAYIYFGGATMDNTADIILTGEAAGNNVGCSVSTAGDVNGDGFSDVIVGAYINDEAGSNSGKSYIYFGGSNMDSSPDVEMTGEAEEDFFGYSVSTAGDVNGDGFSDVIIGAYGNDEAGSSSGKAYIYFGGASMDNTPDIEITGEATGNEFGYSVSNANDVNGDGFSDVIIGAYKNDAGRVYVYFGGSKMDSTADVILSGESTGDQFGYSVSTAGDVNEDGYSDIIVGANHNGEGGKNAGKAYIYFGGASIDNTPDVEMTGEMPGDYLGITVSDADDLNGDSYSDVVVGAYGNDVMGNLAGRAYVYFGGTAMNNTADIVMSGEAEADYFGCSVSTAGDINGDGYSEVIVGACRNDLGGINAGRAYIYSISLTGGDIPDLFITGNVAGDNFGSSVSSAGDVNGDGFPDIIVGAVGTNSGRGSAYIYLGGPQMNYIADVILTGENAGDHFGTSVSTAGDVNRDGYSDVIVGTGTGLPPYGFVKVDTGKAYIFYGGAFMDNTADVIMTGNSRNEKLGWSVSTAGDVNKDGYSDVIVGSYDIDIEPVRRAYIYYGGASMDNIADVVLTGEINYYFGSSVSTTGDLNGDGYSDVIVGATPFGTTGTGRVYIYYGGASMDITADVEMTEEAAEDYFGSSVSSAGDVNGDGYSDVIIGGDGNDIGGENAGRVYVFLSSSPPIKPHIMSVKDVPSDQGGNVLVSFIRSGYDIKDQNRITEYFLQRSDPPGLNGYEWNSIASIKATHSSKYSYAASTPSDSFSNSSGTYFFRVVTFTENPTDVWYSNILSGHSVDNLAPVAPHNFYAKLNSSQVHLGWKANQETDLRDYYIYRSTTLNIDNPISLGSTTDTVFTDTPPTTSNIYYFVQAFDLHDNGSPFSVDSITSILSVNTTNKTPDKFELLQNYPNPFNPTTNIQFTIPKTTYLKINVYTILGEKVLTVAEGKYKPGFYKVEINASGLPSGVYIYRIESATFTDTKKMIYLK